MRYNLWQFFSYEKKRKIKNKDWKIPWTTKKKQSFFEKKKKEKEMKKLNRKNQDLKNLFECTKKRLKYKNSSKNLGK